MCATKGLKGLVSVSQRNAGAPYTSFDSNAIINQHQDLGVVLECTVMAQLIVRDLPVELVQALKRRAAMRNRSAEQEHREILKAALSGTRRRPLAAVLKAIPNVGEDADFRREQKDRR
jgi:plasmid stability protein